MKMRRYVVFWVLMSLYLLAFVSICYLTYFVQNMAPEEGKAFLGKLYGYPLIWDVMGFVGSSALTILGMVMLINVTNEFTYKTHRQNVIDGWSRSQFVTAKWLVMIIMIFFSVLLYVVSTFCFSIGINGWEKTITNFGRGSFDIVKYAVQSFTYLGFAFMLGLLIKRTGLAIAVYLLYTIIFEQIINALLFKYFGYGIGRFLPLQCADDLIPNPFIRNLVEAQPQSYNNSLWFIIAGYMAIYFLFTYRYFGKRDL